MHTIPDTPLHKTTKVLLSALLLAAGTSWAQTAAPSTAKPTTPPEEDVIILSPFEVSATNDNGYSAATTLAGNRLNTELRDIGNAVSVITGQFLKDIGATNNETLLQYTTGTEVGSVYGNFAGMGDGSFLDESTKFIQPNNTTRVRGLTAADNTRDYFMSDIPWDGFDVDGVDLQRGPNSILFGQGSPAGIINIRTKQASFRNSNEITARYGSFGSRRGTIDINRVLIKDQLALRIAAVTNSEKYKQEPAYESQKRIFGAIRWEPAFLKKGGARTIVKGTFEAGDISSNRPRALPPIDLITPWFKTGTYQGAYTLPGFDINGNEVAVGTPRTFFYLNRQTFIPSQLQDDNTGLPNHGQMRPAINGGPNSGRYSPYYNPWLGNYGSQFGGPLVFFNQDATGSTGAWVAEPKSTYGLGSNGNIDGGLALPFQRPTGIATMAAFSKNAGLPYSLMGVYKDVALTDPSIFDFYHKLLDGPNKKEWQKFRTYNLNLAQTFFQDQVGFEVVYNNEWSKRGQLSLLSGERQAIYIDINSVYADGTPAGKNGEPYADGTPNPNVGRPFISDNGLYGNSETVTTREASRATVFATHDFQRDSIGASWVGRLLGKHTLTGLAARDQRKSDERRWGRYGILDDTYEALLNRSSTKLNYNANELVPNTFIYLGSSLGSRTSVSGANLPNPSAAQVVTSGTVRTFDSHWNKPTDPTAAGYVNPAAAWHNDYYPATYPDGSTNPTFASGNSTQSENPANYVGWKNVPYQVTDSEAAPGNRDKLTHDAILQKSVTTSTAVVWQGHFWDNSVVGTWGARKDSAKAWSRSKTTNTADSVRGIVNLSPNSTVKDSSGNPFPGYRLPDVYDNRLDVTSHAWTAVAHLNQLPGIGTWAKDWPIQVSLFYNKSSNFQPEARNVDLYGDPLPAPKGKTVDKGILLETRDGKYSLKINKYETTSLNASSSALGGAWFLGASQAWAGNWVNRFELNWTQDTNAGAVAVNDPTNSQYNYGQGPGESPAQAAAREASVIAAWRTWQKSVNPKFYKAWGINLNDPTKSLTASTPAGFTVPENSVSKGYEYELSANPTRNWRIAINAAKTTAVRTSIGGAAISEFVQAYQTALSKGAKGTVGDLRIWWGGAGNETVLAQWNTNIGSEYAQRKLQEGTNVPEMREWRFNGITNYDFDHGFLKGVNVGGGVRYESEVVIGYKPIGDPFGAVPQFDIAHPYKGPSETNYDFWAGYTRKISNNIEWTIQFNVRNLFVGNELIPITTQPDGSPAFYRIKPPQTWTVTNTFKF